MRVSSCPTRDRHSLRTIGGLHSRPSKLGGQTLLSIPIQRRPKMPSPYMVITSRCIGTKDGACAKVCPVNCFFDAGEMLVIDPRADGGCIFLNQCPSECPVNAIYANDEVPPDEEAFIQKAADFFNIRSEEEIEKLRVSN